MTKPVDADNMEIVRLRTDTTHCSAAPTNKTMAPAFSISIAFHFKRAGSRYHYLLNVRGARVFLAGISNHVEVRGLPKGPRFSCRGHG